MYSNEIDSILGWPPKLEEPGFRRMPIIRAREFLIQHLIQHFF